jgi:predicted esterase
MGGWLPDSFLTDAPAPPGAPALRALHGKADSLVPFARTKAVLERLEKAGWDATYTGYPGAKHTLGSEMRGDMRYHVKEIVLLSRMKKEK